jgi:hypothetical protein
MKKYEKAAPETPGIIFFSRKNTFLTPLVEQKENKTKQLYSLEAYVKIYQNPLLFLLNICFWFLKPFSIKTPPFDVKE